MWFPLLQAKEKAEAMLGNILVTKQTGEERSGRMLH